MKLNSLLYHILLCASDIEHTVGATLSIRESSMGPGFQDNRGSHRSQEASAS